MKLFLLSSIVANTKLQMLCGAIVQYLISELFQNIVLLELFVLAKFANNIQLDFQTSFIYEALFVIKWADIIYFIH